MHSPRLDSYFCFKTGPFELSKACVPNPKPKPRFVGNASSPLPGAQEEKLREGPVREDHEEASKDDGRGYDAGHSARREVRPAPGAGLCREEDLRRRGGGLCERSANAAPVLPREAAPPHLRGQRGAADQEGEGGGLEEEEAGRVGGQLHGSFKQGPPVRGGLGRGAGGVEGAEPGPGQGAAAQGGR